MYAGKPLCCLVNPVLGREVEGLPKAEKAKKVYVIGGGVAGRVLHSQLRDVDMMLLYLKQQISLAVI